MNIFFERKYIIQAILIFTCFILIVRLFYIQVIDDSYFLSANNNVLRKLTVYPVRGIIYDRKGRIIDMYGNVKGYRSSYYSDGYVYPRGNGNNSDYYYRNENDGDLRGDDRNDNMYYRQNDRTTKEDTTIKKTR
jgi:hypothetical protein